MWREKAEQQQKKAKQRLKKAIVGWLRRNWAFLAGFLAAALFSDMLFGASGDTGSQLLVEDVLPVGEPPAVVEYPLEYYGIVDPDAGQDF
ncbi:MAG: hypothetical protein OXB95_11425 [Rhodobacteraceae bacterium]|nr:hypothetical protein [Paracoccaceae bacterium]